MRTLAHHGLDIHRGHESIIIVVIVIVIVLIAMPAVVGAGITPRTAMNTVRPCVSPVALSGCRCRFVLIHAMIPTEIIVQTEVVTRARRCKQRPIISALNQSLERLAKKMLTQTRVGGLHQVFSIQARHSMLWLE